MTVTMKELRDRLKPYNPEYDGIKLTYNYNYGYVPQQDVYDALDALEKKMLLVSMEMDTMNALEKLAFWLLVDSAGLNR